MLALLLLLACNQPPPPPPPPATLAEVRAQLQAALVLAKDGRSYQALTQVQACYQRFDADIEPWARHAVGERAVLELEYTFARLQHDLQDRAGHPARLGAQLDATLAALPVPPPAAATDPNTAPRSEP